MIHAHVEAVRNTNSAVEENKYDSLILHNFMRFEVIQWLN